MTLRIQHLAGDGRLDLAPVAFRQGTGSILATDARADDPKGGRIESPPDAIGLDDHLEALHPQLEVVSDAGEEPGLVRENHALGGRRVEARRLHRGPGTAFI